jgi:hypothetical protein
LKKSRNKLFYLLFIGIVIVIVIVVFYINTNFKDEKIDYNNNPSESLQKKITKEDIEQVRERTKAFCEGYFNFTSGDNPESDLELLEDYLHPKFDKNARKEYLEAMQAPNRSGILFVSMYIKGFELFVDESVIGREEEFLSSIVKLKIEYTYFLNNEVLKEEKKEDYILFWSRDKNKWKVTSLESYDPKLILDY